MTFIPTTHDDNGLFHLDSAARDYVGYRPGSWLRLPGKATIGHVADLCDETYPIETVRPSFDTRHRTHSRPRW